MTLDERYGITPKALASMTGDERRRLRRKVIRIGLRLLRDERAPMPLWKFSERLAMAAGVRVLPDLGELSDAVKSLLWHGSGGRLRLIATPMAGVGYVYDRDNPDTWPLVSMA